jgi:hypothetical protein
MGGCMSETPETDGIEFKAQLGMMPPYDTVPAEFARRLERERDKAISRFEALKEFCETELGWMYFRAEFLKSKAGSKSNTIENARHLQAYLKELK